MGAGESPWPPHFNHCIYHKLVYTFNLLSSKNLQKQFVNII